MITTAPCSLQAEELDLEELTSIVVDVAQTSDDFAMLSSSRKWVQDNSLCFCTQDGICEDYQGLCKDENGECRFWPFPSKNGDIKYYCACGYWKD